MKMKKIYHIDNPNHEYELHSDKAREGYFYAVLYHPTFMDIKLLKDESKGTSWFDTADECRLARIKRIERELAVEKECHKRKL